MSLFPKCSFEILTAGGLLVPGTRVDGTLVVTAPDEIPRAERIDLVFSSIAWAAYGSGNGRSIDRRVMFRAPFAVDVPGKRLAAGAHRLPFTFDLPAWLPPAFHGPDCAIEHLIETRVDVDWAIDPVATLRPAIAMAPRSGVRAPLTRRSPNGFHESLVLEVTLASSVIAHDEPLTGQIALRSGHDARFDAIELTMASAARIVMANQDRRRGGGTTIRIPAQVLRSGEAVAFQFHASEHVPPSFRSSFIDHEVVLGIKVDLPWSNDISYELALDVLPPGSIIEGGGGVAVVGGERLRRIAHVIAQSTGLREGHPPALVEGAVEGPVGVCISDAPRDGSLGLDIDILYPDVELGLDFRPLGALEGFRSSPLLPPAAATTYLLRCKSVDARPPVDDAAVAAFVRVLLGDERPNDSVRLSDHHLGMHLPIPNDELPRLIAIAQSAHARAKAIAAAIAALPFPAPLAGARAAWLATAAEQNAFLVPTGPSLHGLSFGARVAGGEERVISATLRTRWTKKAPTTHVDVDLKSTPLPKTAWSELESTTPTERMRAVRALFPTAHVLAGGNGVTLERPEWTPDPRALLPAIESFFEWVLDTRGERRQDLPYR